MQRMYKALLPCVMMIACSALSSCQSPGRAIEAYLGSPVPHINGLRGSEVQFHVVECRLRKAGLGGLQHIYDVTFDLPPDPENIARLYYYSFCFSEVCRLAGYEDHVHMGLSVQIVSGSRLGLRVLMFDMNEGQIAEFVKSRALQEMAGILSKYRSGSLTPIRPEGAPLFPD